jgi:hypothetical protein
VGGCESATTSAISTGPTPVKCQVTLAPPSSIVADGGASAFSISTQPECAWTVSTQASWISDLSPASGQGNGRVEFRAAPNMVPTMREGDIVVNDNQVRVRQEAAACQFTIAPQTQTIPAGGGTATVTVSALSGCTWTARRNDGWITITSGEAGNGNGTVSFRVDANSGGLRSGSLTIADRTHTVNQQAPTPTPIPPPPPPPPPPPVPVCNYAINPTSQNFSPLGGVGTPVAVTTTASCAWTAASSVSWILITSGASGTGNGTVAFIVEASLGLARTGTMTIAGQTFTVNQVAQNPGSCTWVISPTSASMPAAGGTGTIDVAAPPGCAWTASNSASWITFTTGTSGNGDGQVGFLVLPNAGQARSDTIAIAGHAFTVTQQ